MAFLTKEKPFWPKPFQPKPFRDLSLATMLVLEQSLSLTVLVIIILGEQKDKLPGKR